MNLNNHHPAINAASFDRYLTNGFGRVIPFLRENDTKPFRESILHACGHNLAFDLQCEDTREVYLYDVIEATGELDYYVPRVLTMLESDEDLSTSQLYGLAGLLARAGHAEARLAVYRRFEYDISRGDLTGGETIVDVDGIDGYVHIALMLKNGDYELDETDRFGEYWLLDHAIERLGVKSVWSALDQLKNSDPSLARYLDRVEGDRQEWLRKLNRRKDDPALTYKMLRALIDDPMVEAKRIDWWHRGKRATASALRQFTVDLAETADREQQLKIMHMFWRRDFLGDVAPLLDLVGSADIDLKRAARRILKKTTDPRIRARALELIKDASDLDLGLELLAVNGSEQDYGMLLSIAQSNHVDDAFHSLGIDITNFIERHPSPKALPILSELYERGRCTMCRCTTIERMVDCEVAPAWILEEAVYDAYTCTREKAANAIATQGS